MNSKVLALAHVSFMLHPEIMSHFAKDINVQYVNLELQYVNCEFENSQFT